MARREAERFIEARCILAALVRGELHQLAAARAAHLDRPFEEGSADALAAQRFRYAYGFDVAAPHAHTRYAGDEGELQAADNLSAALGHGEELVVVALDRLEGGDVGGVQGNAGILALLADLVVGD